MEKPKHPKALTFVQQKLFSGLTSFCELESRIAALPSEKERGDAFEVFAEAYLATEPTAEARQVWPHTAIPLSVVQQLALPALRDMGVDGVFETTLGEFRAYQVKFRSGRPALTWTELSTFMGLTDKVGQRLLFTNCDDLPSVMQDRAGFYFVSGTTLDKLEQRDFEAIAAWLEGAEIRRERKQPQPHQEDALANILPAFEKHDRATAVMACGTGKTLVALWTAERLGCRNILVLVPSLALLRQTLHEWLRETTWEELSYLCVCSDPSVDTGADELIVQPSELDFPVTTDSQTVRTFLTREFDGVKIVFSTYQSTQVVADGVAPGFAFDLGIFDEAHKTAGREGGKFSFALKDDNLLIRKRLFMTATPRHYDIRHRDKEGDAKLVYSMDVSEAYGLVAHKLSFAEAARRGIICNYKVVISVVTSEMVNDELLRRSEVIVRGDVVKARQVANQIALAKAVEKYGVSKVFTFHRSVASACSFTSEGGEGIANHLPNFEAYHVNGTMPTVHREHLMTAFRAASKAVMSNARCLTEGVDVPAVDMVAFLTPKRSRVDIVQATGRAMRKIPGKITGYVIVPLFLELARGETVEDAVARAEFDEIWSVLQAMQEQDDALAEIISRMREERGRVGCSDNSRFEEKIEVLGPTLSLEALRRSISAACLDQLGASWDEFYGQLEAFKMKFGNCEVPSPYAENPSLARWVKTQRKLKKEEVLNTERAERLDAIGFTWDLHQKSWEMMYAQLVEYKKACGHCNVPSVWPKNPRLAMWVGHQRRHRKRGWQGYGQLRQLSDERVRRLDEIGFSWDLVDTYWDEMFSALVGYKAAHGHCNVPLRWSQNPQLGQWVGNQRQQFNKGALSQDRVRRLNELGLIWNSFENNWERMFSALAEYRKTHGNSNVPYNYSDRELAKWVSHQRTNRKRALLSQDRIRRLDELGFIWDTHQAAWQMMFSILEAYKQSHGDCNVPIHWKENPKLGLWVAHQRARKRSRRIRKEWERALDELGFVWKPLQLGWEQMFAVLVQYKQTHGDCNVSRKRSGNSELSQWIGIQRRADKEGTLSKERKERLNDLGFIWDARDARWERMFSSLVEYKNTLGDCNVPHGWAQNPRLAEWVCRQRTFRKQRLLSEFRIKKLDDLGFVWNIAEAHWAMMFSTLVEFHKIHGHCNVPAQFPNNPQLGKWVAHQRQNRKKALLSQDRIRRLDELGFQWHVRALLRGASNDTAGATET